ncbi:SHOCT domain-containing protein [Salipiger sp. P9]|uniref:SHOCT domain-containing protein n=1 Tax=Salipiger pentaromativorans TaxID=2943193 RepID=UPI002158958E|nr:SHOCT domain-containing protein [Salipiger pentaromativorans]MCR8546435.1 SHOCT domain-containing protein [Salipiger pentaromativorans]
MTALTPEGTKLVSEIADRHGVSPGAAETVLVALVAGQGVQAQFNHPELGGMGQWSQGGMTMVGDMFNNALKAKVDALCSDLAGLLAEHRLFRAAPVTSGTQSQSQSSGTSLFLPGGAYGAVSWPAELGSPSSVGAQNNLRYAVFPETHRLAIDIGGKIEVFDTGDHRITGVSQQQSGDQSLTFVSQHGLVQLGALRKLSDLSAEAPAAPAPQPAPAAEPVAEAPVAPPVEAPVAEQPAPAAPMPEAPETAAAPAQEAQTDADAVISLIRKLGDLLEAGLLTQEEFDAKKRDLLARL